MDQVKVDISGSEPLEAPLERPQRDVTPMIRELSRDEDVLTTEATPIERFADAALGAIARSSVNHPVTRFKPVQDSLDRISARYRQPKSDLWDVVPVAQLDVRNRDVALVTRHDDL